MKYRTFKLQSCNRLLLALICMCLAQPIYAQAERDIDGDGRSDIIWYSNDSLAVWKMNGAAAAPLLVVPYPTGWALAGTGDFNGDARADLLWRGPNRELALWYSNGSGFTGASIGFAPIDWGIRAVGDLNGDGRADILWRYGPTGEIAYWRMNGASVVSGGMTGVRLSVTGDVPLGFRDLNGDGRGDFVLRRGPQHLVWTATTNPGTGLIQFSEQALLGAEGWTLSAVADMSGDGKSDLIWRNSTFNPAGHQVAYWRMDGTVALGGGLMTPGISANMSVATQGDFNGDGREDLVWAYSPTGQMQIWISSGTDMTVTALAYPAGWSAVSW